MADEQVSGCTRCGMTFFGTAAPIVCPNAVPAEKGGHGKSAVVALTRNADSKAFECEHGNNHRQCEACAKKS